MFTASSWSGNHLVYILIAFQVLIITRLVPDHQEYDDAGRQGNRQTQYIQQAVFPVLLQVSEGDFEIVLDHGEWFI